MAIQYRIYANDGAGGPVDYAAPIGTTAALAFTPTALPPGSDWTFAVRAFDDATGLEERNVSVRTRIALDAEGRDVTDRPRPPVGLSSEARAGGLVRLRWLPGAVGPAPTEYRVYAGVGAVDYGTPVATVPAPSGWAEVRADLAGLDPAMSWRVGVRAANASGEETNLDSIAVAPDDTPPDAVDGLIATVAAP